MQVRFTIFRITLLSVFLLSFQLSVAQDSLNLKSSNLLATVDSILSRSDSLAVFHFLDSMMNLMDDNTSGPGSSLAIRTGYNSNITATGRPFALTSFGLNTGLSYFNKNGFYADVSGYVSREYQPSWFLTTITAGYLQSSQEKNRSMTIEYSRYLYNLSDDATISYTGNLALTGFLNIKHLMLRAEYNLYHGTKTGHRLTPSASLNIMRENFAGFDKIQLWPGIQLLFGLEQISSYRAFTTIPSEIRERIRKRLPLFYESVSNKAGLMNASFNTPLNLQKDSWNFMIIYSYNIPVALPGETLDLEPGGYLSFSVTKYFFK